MADVTRRAGNQTRAFLIGCALIGACSARDLDYLGDGHGTGKGGSGGTNGGETGETRGGSSDGGTTTAGGTVGASAGAVSEGGASAGAPSAGMAGQGGAPEGGHAGSGGETAGESGGGSGGESGSGGIRGDGGTSGSAGAGGEGASPGSGGTPPTNTVEPDPPRTVLSCGGTTCGDVRMIADFEINDGTVCTSEGRAGYGLIVGDGTGTQWPANTGLPLTKFSPLPSCRGKSAVAFHVKGKDFTSWGAGMAVHFAGTTFDASAYSGISFWAMSPTLTRAHIQVTSAETQPVTYDGGECVDSGGKHCSDHFGTDRTLTATWVFYTITFAELKQAGWGVPAPTSTIDRSKLIEFDIIFQKLSDYYDVWLDDVAFVE